MVKYLTPEEVAILKAEFDHYDADKGGNITTEEFGRVMKASGQNPTDEELAQIIKEVDLDGDGTINFDEFIAMMTGRSREPPKASPPPPQTVTIPPAPTIVNITNNTIVLSPSSSTHAPLPYPDEPEIGPDRRDSDKMVVESDPQEEWKKAWKEFDPSLKSSITAARFHQVLMSLGEIATDAEVDELVNNIDGEDKITYHEFAEFMKKREGDVDDIVGGYAN